MTAPFAALATAALLVCAAPAHAFDRVASKSDFVGLVNGKALTRMGITLAVLPDGRIEGRAFGRPVKGDWRWRESLFCRDLTVGERNLGLNCQVVQRRGDTLRFIADEGRGDYADLRIR